MVTFFPKDWWRDRNGTASPLLAHITSCVRIKFKIKEVKWDIDENGTNKVGFHRWHIIPSTYKLLELFS